MARFSEKQVRDIAEKRQRTSAPDRSASWRMSILLQAFNNPIKHQGEVLRYYPIAVVAAIEGYFRARLASLIDSGDPFLSNAVSAFPEVRLDTPLAGAIALKKISLGELITNSISINNFDGLVQTVNRITGESEFLQQIAQMPAQSLSAPSGRKIISDPENTWIHLGKVFSLRHVLCHELAPDLELDPAEVRGLLLASQEFMRATSAWLDKLQFPNPPPTFEQRKEKAEVRLVGATRQLHALLEEINHNEEIRETVRKSLTEAYQLMRNYSDVMEQSAANARHHLFEHPYMEESLILGKAQTIEFHISRLHQFLFAAGVFLPALGRRRTEADD